MRTFILLVAVCTVAMFSCKKDDLSLTGEPSQIGAVGNVFDISHGIAGVENASLEVVALNGGVSTLQASFDITNPDLLAILDNVESDHPISVVGNTVSTEIKIRFTTDGAALVFDNLDEELVLCKYDADVGDEWQMNIDGRNVKHKVTQRSSNDDYPWGFLMIKVVTMEGTNYGIPILNRVEIISNHRFGPVGVKGYFIAGNKLEADIFSLFNNE